MEVIYKLRASKRIDAVVEFVENRNTEGSGRRWFHKLDAAVQKLAKSKARLAICKHPSLAKFNYRCFTYEDWVLAYRISENKFEVCRFILGSRLA